MSFGFKPNAKQLVTNKLTNLYGKTHKFDVVGMRMTDEQAKELGVPRNRYYVKAFVDGVMVGETFHQDWRKAYKLLVVEVEKTWISEGENKFAGK